MNNDSPLYQFLYTNGDSQVDDGVSMVILDEPNDDAIISRAEEFVLSRTAPDEVLVVEIDPRGGVQRLVALVTGQRSIDTAVYGSHTCDEDDEEDSRC